MPTRPCSLWTHAHAPMQSKDAASTPPLLEVLRSLVNCSPKLAVTLTKEVGQRDWGVRSEGARSGVGGEGEERSPTEMMGTVARGQKWWDNKERGGGIGNPLMMIEGTVELSLLAFHA